MWSLMGIKFPNLHSVLIMLFEGGVENTATSLFNGKETKQGEGNFIARVTFRASVLKRCILCRVKD